MIKVSQEGATILFSAVSLEEANKIRSMSADEAMIYSHIEEAGRDGIWTKTLNARTNLHINVITRCIKSLESQRYIKQVKSVKHPTRKIYILSSMEPSQEMSGGPWFTDAEIDTEFIDSLLNVIWRYVVSISFPNAFGQGRNVTRAIQQSYPATYKGYPPVGKIHDFIVKSGITNVDLSLVDVRTLCEVLVYDDRLERIDGGYSYKATWSSVVAAGGGPETEDDEEENAEGFDELAELDPFTETPCGQCPVLEYCSPKGLVNASDCLYFDEYLNPGARQSEASEGVL